MEMLRHESKRKQESVENNQRWAEESINSDPDRAKSFQVDLKHAKRKAAIYQQAYEATKVDAERLCPGKTFTSATGIASLGRRETVTSINVFKEVVATIQEDLASEGLGWSTARRGCTGTKVGGEGNRPLRGVNSQC